MSAITSRDNPRVRRWQKLVRDARERRKQKRALIEGEHLVAAFLDAGGKIEELILSKTAAARIRCPGEAIRKDARACCADAVFRSIADTESPSGIAAEIVDSESKGQN